MAWESYPFVTALPGSGAGLATPRRAANILGTALDGPPGNGGASVRMARLIGC